MYIVLLTLVLLFWGCTSTPNPPQKNSVTLPKAYIQTQNIHVNDAWWKAFNDEQLNGFIETALTNNRHLKAAIQNVKAAQAIIKQTRSLQKIQLEGTATLQRNLQNSSAHSNAFTLGLGASYELDFWGRLDALEQASIYDFNASEEELNTVAITLSAEVALAWYRLLEQYQQLQLLDKQIAINKKYLKLLISQFNISKVRAVDIIQQRQSLAALQGEKEPTRALMKRYQTQLALLLGTDISQLHADLKHSFKPEPVYKAVSSVNLLERPDVKAAFYKLQAVDQRVAAAVANSYPRISLGGTLSTNAVDIDELFKNWFATLAANVTAPLLDGGRRDAEVAQQIAMSRAAMYEYENTLLSALKEVQDMQSALLHQHRYLKSIKEQLRLSLASSRRIRQQYIHANGDFLRLLSAQLNYEQLQRNYLKAHRQLIEYDIALHRSIASKVPSLKFQESLK
jgi:NodT family efflux transporter outer membrane factor (OMF) lipoprotein